MKTRIKILFVMLSCIFYNSTQAQVSVTLNVDSHPTPQISEWVNRANLAIVSVTNANPAKVGNNYKIKVNLKLNDNIVLETNNSVATQSLILGTQTFLADEIIPYNAIVFKSNTFKLSVLNTGLLPAGMYDFCVSVIDLSGNVISSPAEICQPMIITDYQMPELLTPLSDDKISTNLASTIIFKWSPLVPEPQPLDGVKYMLAVTKVMPGQTPTQAFYVNYPLIEEEVMGTQFNWPTDIDIPTDTTQYVWSIKPLTLNGNRYILASNGFVPIKSFTLNPIETATDSTENEQVEVPITTGTVAVGDTIQAGENHEFKILVSEIAAGTIPNSFTGKGTVKVGFLGVKVAVEFKDIKVDSIGNLTTGKISGELYPSPAPVYPQDWAIGAVSGLTWTSNILKSVVSWVEGVAGTKINIGDPLNNAAPPVKFPLGVNFASGDQLAITEMVFKSNVSEINIVAAKTTPPSWQAPGTDPQLIGFKAKEVEFHPSQLKFPPKRIELLEDVTINNINSKLTYTFKKPTDSISGGCYIQWGDEGFSQFGVQLDVSFTRDWLKPSPDDGVSRSKATFTATVADWDNMLLTGNLEKSEITSSQEMTIEAGNISFDMSDTMNPPTLTAVEDFPENYSGDKTAAFRGFYMETLSVEMPKSFETNSGGRPTITINDMIINDMGVSLYAVASNVIQFPNANVADLSASIDTIHVDIRNSSMYEAYIKGKIGLPVSKSDSIQNPLKYKALFHNAPVASTDPDYFQLTVEPTGPIYAGLLKGKMTLDETSNIIAYVDKNKRTFQSNLDGQFAWENIKLGPVKNVNMTLGFQNIQMNYNSSLPTTKFNFNAGTWSFASPQKFLANFPVTIENIGFNQLTTTPNQLVHGKLNFDVIFNLSNDIGGKSKLGVELAIDENPAGSGLEKFKPKYIGTTIDDITVYAHLAAVSIDGTISFRNDDPVFGDGFKGELNATFKSPKVSITALAEFGNTSYLYSSRYRYWRVEAAALFQPGLPFLSGVAFYGFGGGAFSNMESKLEFNATLGKDVYTFTPKKGNLGFKVKATIGTTPKVETFNADVGLNGQFSSTEGLINIGFTGDFYVGAKLMPQTEREQAQIKGNVLADYNFPDKHFFLSVNASINKDPVVANNQQLVLDINGKTNKWFFKFGEPTNTNNVSIFGINLYEYLMFGNDVYAPANGFTNRFRNNYYSILNNYPGIPSNPNGGVDANSATGRGFALGVGFEFNKLLNKNVTGNYDVNLNLNAGAEVNLSMMEYIGQNCADPSQRIGFAGWRARGNIGMYLNAAAYVKNTSNNNTWNLANIKAGAWIDAKFPRPTFVAGAIEGNVQIGGFTTKIHSLGDCSACCSSPYHLDRRSNCGDGKHWGIDHHTECTHLQQHYLVNQSFSKSFTWGDDCGGSDSNSSTNTGPAVAQGDAANDQQQSLIKYVHPATSYNFPVKSPIAVKYGLPLDEAFDVTEQQSNGSVITRTFKLVNTVVLQKLNETTNTYINVTFNTDKNSLSEYLYTVKEPFTGTVGSATLSSTALNKSTSGKVGTSTASVSSPNLNAQAVTSVKSLSSPKVGSVSSSSSGKSVSGSISGTMFTIFPAPTLTLPSEYDNLPPASPEVVNALELNKSYKIIVTAILKEYKNNVWVNALKSNGTSVQQTITKTFKTGAMTISASTSNASVSF